MPEKSYSSFLTRPLANEGVKVFLYTPLGERTKHWLKIIGADSDAYREGQIELFRLKIASAKDGANEDSSLKEYNEKYTEVLAHCIIEWSFKEELTFEEAKQFLKDAPRVRDTIDETIRNTELFFKKKSKTSSPTVKRGSSSIRRSQVTSKA